MVRILFFLLIALSLPHQVFAQPSHPPFQIQYNGGAKKVCHVLNVLSPNTGSVTGNSCTISGDPKTLQWTRFDTSDLPTETLPTIYVNKIGAFHITEVCCYANVNGADIGGTSLDKTSSATTPLPTPALPTPAACGTPGWSGSAGCVSANVAVSVNDSLTLHNTTAAGVTRITYLLKYLLD